MTRSSAPHLAQQKGSDMKSRLLPGAVLASTMIAGGLIDSRGSSLMANAVTVESPQKIEGWGEVADASGQCRVRAEGTRVTIEVPAGSYDLYPDGQKVNAPRLTQDASGDFTVQVKVVGIAMGEKGAEAPGRDVAFNAATLVIWQDESNFVRLDRAGFHKAGTPNHQTYYHVYRDGRRTVHEWRPLAARDTWLRLQRQGTRVTAAWSQDGRSWQNYPAGSVALADKVRVGVAVLNASSKPFAAIFEDLTLTSGKVSK
jgi:regulation of enolase protein 1 (concanavalin A-like superfamily)